MATIVNLLFISCVLFISNKTPPNPDAVQPEVYPTSIQESPVTRYPDNFNITLLEPDCSQLHRSDDPQCGLANAQCATPQITTIQVIQGSQPENLNTRTNQNSEIMMNHDIELTTLTCDPNPAADVAQFISTMDRRKYSVPLTILIDIHPTLLCNLMCFLPLLLYMFSTPTTISVLPIVPALLLHPVQGMAPHPTNLSTAITNTVGAQFWAGDCNGLVKQPCVTAYSLEEPPKCV